MDKITMSVAELGEIMGISKPKAYELSSQRGFPCIQIGRRKIIPVDAFKKWLDGQTQLSINREVHSNGKTTNSGKR